MKKFLYLLLLPVLGLSVASCEDDEKRIPYVDITAEISGATLDQGTIYVVQGDTLKVDAINMVNNSGKPGGIGPVNYLWDYVNFGTSHTPPYGIAIPTDRFPVGKYLLTARTNIIVESFPICFGVVQFPVQVVESADELPTPQAPSTVGGQVTDKE